MQKANALVKMKVFWLEMRIKGGGEFKMNILRSQDLAFSQENEAAITLTLELVDESGEYAEVILPPNITEDDKRIKTVKMNLLPITISPLPKEFHTPL